MASKKNREQPVSYGAHSFLSSEGQHTDCWDRSPRSRWFYPKGVKFKVNSLCLYIVFLLSEMASFFHTGNTAKYWGWTTTASLYRLLQNDLPLHTHNTPGVILLVQLARWLISISGQIKLSSKMDLAPGSLEGDLRRWPVRSKQAATCFNKQMEIKDTFNMMLPVSVLTFSSVFRLTGFRNLRKKVEAGVTLITLEGMAVGSTNGEQNYRRP